jgi:hypothetical protein
MNIEQQRTIAKTIREIVIKSDKSQLRMGMQFGLSPAYISMLKNETLFIKVPAKAWEKFRSIAEQYKLDHLHDDPAAIPPPPTDRKTVILPRGMTGEDLKKAKQSLLVLGQVTPTPSLPAGIKIQRPAPKRGEKALTNKERQKYSIDPDKPKPNQVDEDIVENRNNIRKMIVLLRSIQDIPGAEVTLQIKFK